MKLIALLSWFDEPADLLDRCVRSLAEKLSVDHLIAIDGRYSLYIDERVASPNCQVAQIRSTCREVGIRLTAVRPMGEWDSEPAKRTFMFTVGNRIARRGDWFFVVDADVRTRTAPPNLRERLFGTEHNVATVMAHDTFLAQCPLPGYPTDKGLRALFRAQPIRVVGDHTTYVGSDGSILWSEVHRDQQVESLDLRDAFIVDHFPYERPLARDVAKQNYYLRRDDLGAERLAVARP